MLDMLGRQVGDLENASDDATRWSEILHYSMPMMANIHTQGKKD